MSRGVLSKLAGETAVYGMSTILARVINFFFVPIYTRTLAQSEYGILTEFMAYIAVLQVVLTLGMETGCFRFANKYKGDRRVFSNAMSSVFSVSFALFLCCVLFAGGISSALGYGENSLPVVYVGAILLIDCTSSVIFAKLRHEGRAWKFAIIKTVKILTETSANLVLFFVLPGYMASRPDSWLGRVLPPVPDFSYPLIAILISCVVMLLILLPDYIRIGAGFSKKLLKQMLLYSLPLMVAGLPGVVNEFLDRILFRFFMPENLDWRAELGVYQAAVKLAVIMNLFIQMFRFAAEPFFFARASDKDSKALYAKVMEYFAAFCMLVFLGITLYSDLIGLVLGKDFRGGLHILPVMLFSYVILGISFNVSMWYKLADMTRFAVYITLCGLAVTALVNMVFMPLYSYTASAWGHLLSNLSMLLVSLYFGNKYYPIPYRWGRIAEYAAVALAVYGLSALYDSLVGGGMAVRLAVHTLLLLIYPLYYVKREHADLPSMLRGLKGKSKAADGLGGKNPAERD